MNGRVALLLAGLLVQATGCGNPDVDRPDGSAERPEGSAGSPAAPDTAASPAPSMEPAVTDESVLDGTVERAIVIYVEASDAEIDALRARYPEEDFMIVADDLMFYRATATEHLAGAPYPFVRISGRRPIRFLVDGVPRVLDFADVERLDFIIAYAPDAEPRVIAPNEAERVAEYFANPDGT